jgi:aminopeptidase N
MMRASVIRLRRHSKFLATSALLVCTACAGGPETSESTLPAAVRGPLRTRADSDEINGWSREADLLHVDIDLGFDAKARSVEGTVSSSFRSLRDGTRTLKLNAVGLQIDDVKDQDGLSLDFGFDHPWLIVHLQRALNRGDETTVAVRYKVRPTRGLYFVDDPVSGPQIWSQGAKEDHRYWLPIWDYPNERATFEARLRVAPGMIALSCGALIEVRNERGGSQTYHWRTDVSLPTYLFAVAIGRWERFTDDWRGVPLEYYVAAGTGEERARRAFGETPRMLDFYHRLIERPFPFEKYAQVAVADFPWGGMENASLSIYNDFLIGTADEVADLGGDHRNLVAHELAHQWFGDLVTCRSWSHLWLNDAFASFMEVLYQGEAEGAETMRLWFERYREAFIASENPQAPLVRDFMTPGAERANHVYTKGPWVLYMLQESMGAGTFWNGVRAYLDQHSEGVVTTEDFVRAFFDATGHNIEGMMEQWVESGGYPSLQVSYNEPAVRRGAGAMVVRVRQVQRNEYAVPLFHLDVDVDIHYEGGRKTRHRLVIDELEQDFRIPLEDKPIDIVFDPDCTLLCHVQFDKGPVMWVHQGQMEDNAAAQWRSVDALRALIDRDPVGDVRKTLLWLLHNSPHELLRERVARICNFQGVAGHLLEAVVNDPSPQVRLAAAESLRGVSLNGSQRNMLQEHLFVERSPKTRTSLEEILGVGR